MPIELVMDSCSCHHQACILRGHWDTPGCARETIWYQGSSSGLLHAKFAPQPTGHLLSPKRPPFCCSFQTTVQNA